MLCFKYKLVLKKKKKEKNRRRGRLASPQGLVKCMVLVLPHHTGSLNGLNEVPALLMPWGAMTPFKPRHTGSEF